MDDPLLEEFHKLEREVAQRERAQRQAACKHTDVQRYLVFGRPPLFVCRDCGTHTEEIP